MRKVLVIGSGGAGKSTFAHRLGEALAVEVVHLDAWYWKPGWVEPSRQAWAATLETILVRDAWVMDGNYSGTLARRLEACDTVVLLDLPRGICLWRAIKRVFRYLGKTRPDMAAGCPERFSPAFLRWIWNYRTRSLPKVRALLAGQASRRTIVTLRSTADVERFLRGIEVSEEE